MGIVIDATERFAERRKAAEAARREEVQYYEVEPDPTDKHLRAMREIMNPGGDE